MKRVVPRNSLQAQFLREEADRYAFYDVSRLSVALLPSCALLIYWCRLREWSLSEMLADPRYLWAFLFKPRKAVFISKRDDPTVGVNIARRYDSEPFRTKFPWDLMKMDLGGRVFFGRSELLRALRANDDTDRGKLLDLWNGFTSARLPGWALPLDKVKQV